jgi:hypothetical protein|nr:MAG TPA: antirepressor [Caudoviricetes sp.]
MNNIQIFKYENNDVRTVELNGEPWFAVQRRVRGAGDLQPQNDGAAA